MSRLHSGMAFRRLFLISIFIFIVGCGVFQKAERIALPIQTDLLNPVAGYQGETLGATVEGVQPVDDGYMTEVMVVVPVTTESIETVAVVDKSGRRIHFKKQPEINSEGEEQMSVVLYFGKQPPIPFRLRLNYPE